MNKQGPHRQGRKGEYQGLNCEGPEKQGRKGMKRKEEIYANDPAVLVIYCYITNSHNS